MNIVAIGVLMAIQLVITFEMSMVMPMAPLIASIYQVEQSNVTLLNLGYALSGLFVPFLGMMADRMGNKRILIFSSFLFVIGSALVYVWSNPWGFILGRTILGVGFFALISISPSYLSILVKPEKYGFVSGLHKIAFALAILISPLVATTFAINFGFQTLYLGVMIAMIICTGLAFLMPDVRSRHETIHHNSLVSIFRNSRAVMMMAAVALFSLPSVFYFNYLSIHLNQLGQTAQSIASLYSMIALGSLGAGIGIMLFSDKLGKRRMGFWGAVFSAVFMALTLFNYEPAIFLVGFMFGLSFDLIWGLLFPLATGILKGQTAGFLTLLSFVMSMTNVMANGLAPTVFRWGGFMLNVLVCTIGLMIGTLLLYQIFRKKDTSSI
ncbi:MAG: MFS transporter [Erysipelotrichaceae bacterium]|nr:MFS transporter [Erysipelotrichaceae bacterium]